MILEGLKEVLCYVKNDQRLGFEIPYEFQGRHRSYIPDFIVHIDDGKGLADPLKLIIEVSGWREKERKARKAEVTRKFWCAAVNRLERFGRWDFLELRDAMYFRSDLLRYLEELAEKKRLAEEQEKNEAANELARAGRSSWDTSMDDKEREEWEKIAKGTEKTEKHFERKTNRNKTN